MADEIVRQTTSGHAKFDGQGITITFGLLNRGNPTTGEKSSVEKITVSVGPYALALVRDLVIAQIEQDYQQTEGR